MTGDSAAKGILFASIDRTTFVKQCRATPWHLPLDDATSF
jgi:hypothetical protein